MGREEEEDEWEEGRVRREEEEDEWEEGGWGRKRWRRRRKGEEENER